MNINPQTPSGPSSLVSYFSLKGDILWFFSVFLSSCEKSSAKTENTEAPETQKQKKQETNESHVESLLSPVLIHGFVCNTSVVLNLFLIEVVVMTL